MGSRSSRASPVSSMSVVSVPVDDVAIGEGSAISLGLETIGEFALGGWRELVNSFDLASQRLLLPCNDGNYIGREIGDLYGNGDVGESEYGEKAETRAWSGEGSKGDLRAIIVALDSRKT